MRRSARAGHAPSLELLLDTMCNAFGGVMFIAMLLAVMSQFAEVRPTEEGDASDEALRRRASLAAEVERLRPEVRRREDLLEAADVLRGTVPLLDELRAAEREAEALERRIEEAAGRLAAVQRELEEARREKREKEEALARRHERSAALTNALETRRRDASRELRMPRIRRLRKAPFWSIVKNGRIYVLYRPGRLFARETVNTAAVRHTSYDGFADFDPIPGRGVPLEGDWQEAPDVRRVLGHVPPAGHILYFAVYPDSYAEFRRVRDFFAERGYDYYWVPRPDMDQPLRLQFVTDPWFEGM